MNYKESKQVLGEVKKARRILLNCHRGPDPDSIGSALAMYEVLQMMGKEVDIVCPSDEIIDSISYLKNFNKIQKDVDFLSFDFSKFDLFIALDSSSWSMVTDKVDFKKPDTKIIVIDHHATNTFYGDINIVDTKITSTSELLYLIFQDWKVKISKGVANCLLLGILGDTGIFRFPGSGQRTLRIAADLMDKGADKDKIIYQLYGSVLLSSIRFCGEVLKRVRLERKYKFVWAAIPYKIYKRLNLPTNGKEIAANLFAQVVDGTDFGFLIVENEPGRFSISFRSRSGVDTSRLAKKLGGGGHVFASGARIEGLTFDGAIEKVLKEARKFASESGLAGHDLSKN